MQIENKCQNVMSSQGLELSSLRQLSLGLRFLKSCHFGRTLVLSPQIHHFSLQNRMKKAHSWFLFFFLLFLFLNYFPHFIWSLKDRAHQLLGLTDLQLETANWLLHPTPVSQHAVLQGNAMQTLAVVHISLV